MSTELIRRCCRAILCNRVEYLANIGQIHLHLAMSFRQPKQAKRTILDCLTVSWLKLNLHFCTPPSNNDASYCPVSVDRMRHTSMKLRAALRFIVPHKSIAP